MTLDTYIPNIKTLWSIWSVSWESLGIGAMSLLAGVLWQGDFPSVVRGRGRLTSPLACEVWRGLQFCFVLWDPNFW